MKWLSFKQVHLAGYFLASCMISFGLVRLLHLFGAFKTEGAITAREQAVIVFLLLLVAIFLLLATPKILNILNSVFFRSVDGLGEAGASADTDFRSKITQHFGSEIVENIVAYEIFCKNEYKLEMGKHHFSWIMLALSGIITLAAGIIMIQLMGGNHNEEGSEASHLLITSVAAALPAIVTEILFKIWIETGKSVQNARARVELLHRQRIRMLFLLGRRNPHEALNISELVTEANLILNYIRVGSEAPVTAAVSAAADP